MSFPYFNPKYNCHMKIYRKLYFSSKGETRRNLMVQRVQTLASFMFCQYIRATKKMHLLHNNSIHDSIRYVKFKTGRNSRKCTRFWACCTLHITGWQWSSMLVKGDNLMVRLHISVAGNADIPSLVLKLCITVQTLGMYDSP